jgi:cobalamin biosynthesis protein CobT
VFRKRHETTSKDVAVSLVIDCSGSMSGSKIHTATQAAYALSSVLERIGISHEVVAFTTGQPAASYGELEAEAKKIGRGFTRIEALYMPILKGFNERLKTEVKERFGWLPNSRVLRNNIDGECVEIAARRLMARRESGKVMIVLSDGAPACQGDMQALQRHLKQVVKNIEKAGVKTVGIGIESSEVTKFYPKNIVLHNVSELPDRVIKELRHLLVG